MRILAIETSCDETAIAIIDSGRQKSPSHFRILSNIISSQVAIHKKFGGVVPNLAKREHQKNLVPILISALKDAKLFKRKTKGEKNTAAVKHVLEREPGLYKRFIKNILDIEKPNVDAIAVTEGPGLEPALWVGINFAKALSLLWKLPLIPINHMEGHIFSALVRKKDTTCEIQSIRFPAIALLVSGGHTELIEIKKFGRYGIIGETLDDAAGEAFDKVAQMLKLGYPGGPAISKRAERGNPKSISFPRPMIHSKNFDFSFSGLKTSVLYYLRDHKRFSISDVAASFQQAVIDVLVSKTLRAIKSRQAKTVLVGGGVAANSLLRKTLTDQAPDNTPILLPELWLTGDNALMIACAAVFKKKTTRANAISALGNLKISE